MSTRQLRRLQQKRELEQARDNAATVTEESDDGEEPILPAKPRLNLFAALQGGEENTTQEGGDDDSAEETTPGVSTLRETETPPAVQGKRRAKKKKKKRAAPQAESSTSGVQGTNGEASPEAEDEIDKAVKELAIDGRSTSVSASRTSAVLPARINELLAINPAQLRASNEMRNLFGRDVIQSAEAEEQQHQQAGQQRRQRPRAREQVDLETFLREPPGAPKLPQVSLRRNVFVQGREHWPRQTTGGLEMREVEGAPDGSWTQYTFVHGDEYDRVQMAFFERVQLGDPMTLVGLLKQHPYHISTQLQVSSVAKQDQNMALAAELCERALFTFGRVATSSFRRDIKRGGARLDFRRPENRQFWLAGHSYIRSLIRKGTFRTALEWAKLLYALDPVDPYAMRHYIHALAIRAHQSAWLVAFLEEMDKDNERGDSVYMRQSLVLAKLQLGDAEGAAQLLVEGAKRVPWLYCSLLQELNLDAPPSVWAIKAGLDARLFWTGLYIHQTKELWSNAAAMGLLSSVLRGLGRIDTAALPQDDAPGDRGSTRMAYLEGLTSILAVAPKELLAAQPNFEFDPLPPPEDENILSTEGTRIAFRDVERGRGAVRTAAGDVMDRMRAMFPAGAVFGLGNAGAEGQDMGWGFDTDDDDDDEQIRAVQEADEELRRDMEAHRQRWSRPGLFGQLLRAVGLGRGSTGEETREPAATQAPGNHEQYEEGGQGGEERRGEGGGDDGRGGIR